MIGNFTEVKPLRYWVQHILPLVYDDSLSYMELLGKVVNTLNEVVKNNNLLPEYIMELIKEYISSGEIEKVLAEILANYMLNVKFPPAGLKPATGDGSADDTEAIQGCIDYAYNNGGMSVYFPSGSYLTQPLTLRDKATLFGQDRYTTRLVMKGGATTAMFTGDVDELTLTGLGFDGNMDIQVNNVNLFTISVNSAIITNCLLTDGYDLLNITVNDDLQLNDVIFKHAVENALVLKGAGIVQGNNLIFKSVSTLVGKNFVVMDVSKSILEQLKCYGASPNAVLINGNNNVVKMWNEQSLKAYTDNGVNNTVEVYTQSEQKKLTGFKTTNISGDLTETVGGNKTETITGNKGVSVHDLTETVAGNHTKTVTGDISESAMNFKTVIQLAYELTANRLTEQLTSKEVNATNSTENLGNKTETITGEKEVNAKGSTENIANEKHVIAGSVTEDITGDKHVNTANSIETVQGDKTVTAGDISETAVNKTVHITKDNTEQTDGTRTLTVAGANNETTGARTETVNGNKSEHITGISNEVVDGNKTENYAGLDTTATNGETHRGDQFRILTSKAIQYSKPISEPNFSEFFGYVPMFDIDGVGYNLLTYTENTKKLDTLLDFYYANVLHYGADPTGVNDSTAAIQAALRSGKKHVVIPPGTYICNWARIPSDVSVHGYGAHLVATTGNTIFTNDADGVTGGWVANSNITIEGIEFSAPNPDYCTPIGMGHCTNVTIRDCTFHDIKVWHFIEFNSCKSCTIDNCYFYNYGTAGGGFSEMVQLDYAVNSGVFPWFGPYDSTPTQDTKIVNCSFIGNPNILSGRVPAAIGNHTGGNWVIVGTEISNCYFENLGSALKFVTCHNINFNNSYVNGCNTGIYMGGNIGYVQINNNILIGRSNWINSYEYRGIFIEYQNEATMQQIIGNNISFFGGHGVTLQGTFVNCFNNHIHENGMHGLYVGWADFGSKYSDNICWGNNRLNEEKVPRYDFFFNLTRSNLPTTNPIGDALITNNKFSSCYIGITGDTENAQKSYFVMNFIKGTLVKVDNALVVYGNNWNGWNPIDVVGNPQIGTVYTKVTTDNVQLNAKSWTPLDSLTIPVAGLYMIQGFLAIDAQGEQQGSIRIGGSYRNSYDYEMTEATARVVYCPIAYVKRCSANEVLTLEVWDNNGVLTGRNSIIIATRIG